MLNDVYNRRILELAGTIPRIGRLERPDASATAHSKLCGSTVTIDLKMDGDTVTDFAHDVKACALGQASSSIMARNVVGAKAEELRRLREGVRKMLKDNGAPPADGKWADIAVLEPVRDYKARHASTMLTFDAVVDAINQIEEKNSRQRGEGYTPPSPRRPRPDQSLLLHALAAYRLSLPPFADLLRVCRRGARPLRPVGRRVDDARAADALPAVGHVGHRPRAGSCAARRALVCAVALWAVVVAELSWSMILSENRYPLFGIMLC